MALLCMVDEGIASASKLLRSISGWRRVVVVVRRYRMLLLDRSGPKLRTFQWVVVVLPSVHTILDQLGSQPTGRRRYRSLRWLSGGLPYMRPTAPVRPHRPE